MGKHFLILPVWERWNVPRIHGSMSTAVYELLKISSFSKAAAVLFSGYSTRVHALLYTNVKQNDCNSNISGLSNYTSVSFWWWDKEREWWWLFPSAAAKCQTEIPQRLLSNSERATKVTNENSKVFKESPLQTQGWDDDERASTSGVRKSWLMLVRVL